MPDSLHPLCPIRPGTWNVGLRSLHHVPKPRLLRYNLAQLARAARRKDPLQVQICARVAAAAGTLRSSITRITQVVREPALRARICARAAAVVRVLGETAVIAAGLATHRVVRFECFLLQALLAEKVGSVNAALMVMAGAYCVVYVQLLAVQAFEAAFVRRRR